MFHTRLDRVLALSAAFVPAVLGIGELIARLDELPPLLFWLPTLWGGAAPIFTGGFLVKEHLGLAKASVVLGCVLGFVPSAWTILMPVLLITLLIRTVVTRPKESVPNEL